MTRPADDLRLALDPPAGGRVRVTLSRGDGGAALAEDQAPDGGVAAALAGPLGGFPEAAVSGEALEALGRALGDLALPPRVRAALRAALAGDPVAPVRVRLAAGAGLDALPWEFLHLGDADGPGGADLCGYLGLHARLRLAREPPPPTGAAARPAGRSALEDAPAVARVLLVHADPGAPGFPRLAHAAAEARAVRGALEAHECRRAEVCELPGATPAALRRALREYAPHVLHLIGHGDARPSGGVLVLQGEREGTAAFVYADELAGWVAAAPVRLAVLSTCRGASGEGGLARALAASGVPATVAMQLRLRDAAAGPFSRALYAALLESCPVDEALAQARQAVQSFGPDWGVPLLYLSGDGGPVVAPAAPRPASARPPGGAAALPPTNVPHRPSEAFVGRDGVLAELHRVLAGGRSAALVGMGGLGKTQTAAEYAHAHRRDYPGGVFWVAARDARRLTDGLAALGRECFGAPEERPAEGAEGAAAWARDALARGPGPSLLVCDDVGGAADLGLLPPTGACRLLLTTREGHRVPPGVRAFFLPALDDGAARALLGAADAAAAEREAADAVAALVGGLPLALALVAHHVARLGLSLAEYRTRLEAAPFETLRQASRRFQAATGHDGAVYDALALSWGSLTPEAAGVLEAAACLGRAPIPPELLWEAWGGGARGEFEEAVADLADGALLQRGTSALTVHSLVRAFTQAQASEGRAGAARADRVARAAGALSRRLGAALGAARLSVARAEAAHADAVAAQCRELGLDGALAPLLRPLGRLACDEGRFAPARALYDEGLARLGVPADPAGAALAADYRHERAEALFRLGEGAAAVADARAALRLARRAHGRGAAALAAFYAQVGLYLRHRKRFGRARRFYDRALALAESAHGRGHPFVAECLNNIGTLLEFQGDLDGALPFLAEAEAVYRAALGPDAPLRGVALNNLGRLRGRLDQWAVALAHHEAALAIHEAACGRRHPLVATGLFHSAEAADALGDAATAQARYAEALTLYEHFYGTTNYRCEIVRERLTP